MEKLYTVSKNKTRSWCGSDHELLIDEFRLKLKKVGKTTRPFRSVQFSSLSCVWLLWPHGLQYSRLPCPSQTPRACSNSCPLSQWCHLNIASSVIPFSYSLIIPSIRVFSNESVLHIRWSKYWSFSFSIHPSNEYSGLISFRIDWLDLKSLLQHHGSKASILWHSAFFMIWLSTWVLEKS